MFLDPRIQISIGTGLTQEKSHGTLWVRTMENDATRVKRVLFALDKPHCVKSGLTYGMWASLMRQVRKMGLDPTHMELQVNGKQYCYLADSYKEIYSGATGRATARLGFA